MNKVFYRGSILLFFLLWMVSGIVQAEPAPSTQIWINGENVASEVSPQIVNDRTLIPIYIFEENLGLDIKWDDENRLVTILDKGKKIVLSIGSKEATINGKIHNLDVAPQIMHERTFLPFRAIGELLDMEVGWESATKSIMLNPSFKIQVNGQDIEARVYRQAGSYWVSTDEVAKASGYAVEREHGKVFFVKDKEKIEAPPNTYKEINDHTSVSLNFIEELFGQTGTWNNDKTTYSINYESVAKVVEKKEPIKEPIIEKNKITGVVRLGETIEIQTSKKIEAKHHAMDNPHRIVVDIQNAELQLHAPPQLGIGAESGIKAIRYSQYSPDVVRIVLDLQDSIPYSFNADANRATIKIDSVATIPTVPTPNVPVASVPVPSPSKKQVKIIVDAGHGGADPGASRNGLMEKNLTLGISKKLAENLKADPQFNVVMSRDNDRSLTLRDRIKIANDGNADLFISTHINSFSASTAKGTETFYRTPQSKIYANIVHKHLVQATGFGDRKVKVANFAVIKNTKMPSILVEIGFISNPTEAKKMADENFQQRVAKGLYDGIREYVDKN